MLTRLIYASQATADVGIADIRAIIDSASLNNPTLDITGMLCFDRVNFLQCLEGERRALNHIYNKIAHDPRHHNVTLLDYTEAKRRLFHSWSMAYISAQDDKIKSLIKNYSPNDQFRPQDLNDRQATNLIFDLSQTLNKEVEVKPKE